jgi:hypothetical protein
MKRGYVYALWLNVMAVAIEIRAPGTVGDAVMVIGLAVITGVWTAGGVIVLVMPSITEVITGG